MKNRAAIAAVALIGAWVGLLSLGAGHAWAQITSTTTTGPPTTILPTTTDPPTTTTTSKPTTTSEPTTTAPATTKAPRSTTTAPGSTTTTSRNTIPAPVNQDSAPPATFPTKGGPQSGRMSPVLAWLGGLGLLSGFGLLGAQWFLTKPSRDGWTF